ncbi:DUF421 domain-containing protein [Anaeromicropila populeti]|uniref:Uncharacterized membrane protein YcaP, DUF421 family n=1 Tax=Anaeromicropila populeti TaxID=37658 RepID=A0A1I6KQP1_9FIRM|nr:DUF421 domain-containing protein [Anaeromicropila populeti]SFR93308.1 Uncharacterized membrane protein YcaP, DUF421 family [Anaeromicropila populeti]
MELLYVAVESLSSIFVLFILTKIMGYRQMGELTMFDYINGITIGSIAAEMATSLEEFQKPLVAMIIYTFVVWSLSHLTSKSVWCRRFVAGKPLIILNKDKLYYKNLKLAKMDIDEFLVQCRNNGYFDLSEIETAVLEFNGKLSILPKAEHRPVTPNDMNMTPETDALVANVVIDGSIMYKNLHHTGKDEKWLRSQLTSQGVKDIKDVFLATCDIQNKVTVYFKIKEVFKEDLLS